MTTDSKQWLTTEHDDGNVHVVPLDDERIHTFTTECECKPRTEVVTTDALLVSHNAWDRRELHEPGPAW